jgi:hypothetical protein
LVRIVILFYVYKLTISTLPIPLFSKTYTPSLIISLSPSSTPIYTLHSTVLVPSLSPNDKLTHLPPTILTNTLVPVIATDSTSPFTRKIKFNYRSNILVSSTPYATTYSLHGLSCNSK